MPKGSGVRGNVWGGGQRRGQRGVRGSVRGGVRGCVKWGDQRDCGARGQSGECVRKCVECVCGSERGVIFEEGVFEGLYLLDRRGCRKGAC